MTSVGIIGSGSWSLALSKILSISNITIKKHAGKIDGGYVTSTGWGDGLYNYIIGTKNGKAVQFIIYFIP